MGHKDEQDKKNDTSQEIARTEVTVVYGVWCMYGYGEKRGRLHKEKGDGDEGRRNDSEGKA